MGIRDLIKQRQAEEKNSKVVESKVNDGNSIPQREDTEFAPLGLENYMIEKLQSVINFDPQITVNQICNISGIDEDHYQPNINVPKKVVHIIDKKTGKVVADIPFLQIYSELLDSDPELDYQAFDNKQQKDYESKYISPSIEVIKEATTPKLNSLFGKKPEKKPEEKVETTNETSVFVATNDDLPSNMQPEKEVEIDSMPTQILKRGRKPKALINDVPQSENSQPIEVSKTNTLLQDIADNSNSVIAQLKTLGESIPSAKLPVSTNKQNDGVVDVGEISFDKFRPTTQFIEAISTIVSEFSRYINQTKQKE